MFIWQQYTRQYCLASTRLTKRSQQNVLYKFCHKSYRFWSSTNIQDALKNCHAKQLKYNFRLLWNLETVEREHGYILRLKLVGSNDVSKWKNVITVNWHQIFRNILHKQTTYKSYIHHILVTYWPYISRHISLCILSQKIAIKYSGTYYKNRTSLL